MVLSFILEVLPMEVTALATIGLLWLCNILTIEEAISGFGNKAVSYTHLTLPTKA